MSPKIKLHALIDACEDEAMVETAIAFFNAEPEDWWNTLPSNEQQKTLAALDQLKRGEVVTHEQVMAMAWKKIGK